MGIDLQDYDGWKGKGIGRKDWKEGCKDGRKEGRKVRRKNRRYMKTKERSAMQGKQEKEGGREERERNRDI